MMTAMLQARGMQQEKQRRQQLAAGSESRGSSRKATLEVETGEVERLQVAVHGPFFL